MGFILGDKVAGRLIAAAAQQTDMLQAKFPSQTGLYPARRSTQSSLAAGLLLAVALGGHQAMAQTAPAAATPASPQYTPAQAERIKQNRELEDQEVAERQQPGYAPLGMRVGAFMLNPGIDATAGYTDNLYATSNDVKSDYYTSIKPSLFVQSNWAVHQLELWTSGELLRYLEYTDEGTENFDAYIRGKVDIVRGSWFSVKPFYILDHEKRSSPDAVTGGVEPIAVTTEGVDFVAEHKPARLWFRGDATLKKLTFDDSRLSSGGSINNTDRDRQEMLGGLRAGYELTPGYSAFVEGRANDRKYDSTVDDLGFRRDSSGYELRTGAEIELTGKLKGDVFAGYMWQDYVDSRFENLSTPVFGASLTWNATGLTTVKVKAARTIEETTISNAGGGLRNLFEANIDHELRRNLILSAGGSYSQQEYRGTSRDDDTYELKLKAAYLINRVYKLSGGYTYANRSSTAAAADYDINTVSITLSALF